LDDDSILQETNVDDRNEWTMRLGYLAFEVRRPGRWLRFASRMLGLPDAVANGDGSLGLRLDDAAQRLVLQPGPSDDLAALGLELVDADALDARLERAARAGARIVEADADARRARRVERLAWTIDPAGNRVELVAGLERADTPFSSTSFPRGFRTGPLGIGHAVLISSDPGAMEAFYVDALGFAVTERLDTRVGPIRMRGTFLHCNRRHHSLALFALPFARRLHHFMIEAADIADVGAAFDRAASEKVPLSLSLGQHPDPDGTFSFYGATPSGFDFEIGAGGREIDPAGWSAVRTGSTSSWGHRPRPRLQLQMAGAIVGSRLGLLRGRARP
jgi:2,3-dihydroxybiphenyl 1,2-dioxygenase